MQILTTAEAAAELGVCRQHVALLIRQGRLKARKRGRDWSILAEDLEAIRNRRGPGRPPVKDDTSDDAD